MRSRCDELYDSKEVKWPYLRLECGTSTHERWQLGPAGSVQDTGFVLKGRRALGIYLHRFEKAFQRLFFVLGVGIPIAYRTAFSMHIDLF